jgi:hypothetical protein
MFAHGQVDVLQRYRRIERLADSAQFQIHGVSRTGGSRLCAGRGTVNA